MHRYGNIDFANKISFKTLIKIIQKAEEEENNDKLYQRYLVELPYMKNDTSFEKYCEKLKVKPNVKAKKDNRSEEEIMKELLAIEQQFKERS